LPQCLVGQAPHFFLVDGKEAEKLVTAAVGELDVESHVFDQPKILQCQDELPVQLATLVEANLPLDEALQAAADQSRSSGIKGMLLQVRSRVAEGHTLAYAMGEFPRVFNEMYRAMVNAGEHAGYLGPVLQQLADYTEQRQYTG